ncbi:hypothetical protein D0C16_03455 [Cellvibrio sp. KY-GH-1]|uniref:hypothetical protein n=1 Tax=Cellvibrio sp. KY-GH-1 TaxID=2303332 RepID=UPI001244812A|nr:hypothetical protein [Cellvibrio sp. KY-GH-1]QEY15106.1 hypothetical protein D0C16_03455 [Cellvibrio sp. KY-GH-1]
MAKNCCPKCGSKNLIKNTQRTYDCGTCGAPLLHTWPYFESSVFLVPVFLNLPNQFLPSYWAMGVSLLLGTLGVVLFFKYRDFHIDIGKVNIAIDVAKDELSLIEKYKAGSLGVLDLFQRLDWAKKQLVWVTALSPLFAEHFNRVGGFDVNEQLARFQALKTDVDLSLTINQLVDMLQARVQRYQSYR